MKKEIKDLKILHLTDIHLDLNYTENASVVCSFPICCHIQDGFPESDLSKAKPFGNIRCDTPMKLFDSFLDHIQSEMKDIDAVIITGDFSAHN